MNEKKIGIIILAAALFLLPSIVSSEGELIDSTAVIIADSWTTDGKIALRVASAPTYTLSGLPTIIYNDKVTIDLNKPNLWDNKIINSIKNREAINGRNITKITWVHGKVIYP